MSAISDALKASNDTFVAHVATLESKVDSLIVVAQQTKDALVALQGTVSSGGVATEAELQAIIDAQTAALAAVDAESTKVDTAATAVAP